MALAPVGSAVRLEGSWDGAFGGEVVAGALRDSAALSAFGGSAGVLVFAERSGGRAWLEVGTGTRWLTGILVGASAGPTVEFDELRHPRVGGEATAWVYAGICPYVRVGAVERSGAFVELGMQVPLPVIRW